MFDVSDSTTPLQDDLSLEELIVPRRTVPCAVCQEPLPLGRVLCGKALCRNEYQRRIARRYKAERRIYVEYAEVETVIVTTSITDRSIDEWD
jgi:predicted nucleic acid-binding Zn ribbon protein